MLTLDLPTEPYWFDLPRGVRVEIRPVTTAVMAAAQAGSPRRLGALHASEADLDPDMARGLRAAGTTQSAAASSTSPHVMPRTSPVRAPVRIPCGRLSGWRSAAPARPCPSGRVAPP